MDLAKITVVSVTQDILDMIAVLNMYAAKITAQMELAQMELAFATQVLKELTAPHQLTKHAKKVRNAKMVIV
jgi:hypothetical protein